MSLLAENKALWVAVLLLDGFMLSPVLEAGYTHDEVITANMAGILAEIDRTPGGYTWEITKQWLTEKGRFFPLAFHFIFFFSLVSNPYFCHALAILMILANIYLFAQFITRLTASPRLGIIAALVMPLLFQFRQYLDPILSFHFLLQLFFLFLIGSLLCLVDYLQYGRNRNLILSVLFFAAGALTYEIMYVAVVLHVLLIEFHRPEKHPLSWTVKRSLPLLGSAALFILLAFFMRLYFQVPLYYADNQTQTNPYVMNLDVTKYTITLAKQTYAALPLSWLVIRAPMIGCLACYLKNRFSAGIVLLVIGYSYLLYRLLLKPAKTERDEEAVSTNGPEVTSMQLALFGLAMTIMPGLLIGLSPRFQSQMDWGNGYLPVYISSYGVGTVTVALLWSCGKRLAPIGRRRMVSAALSTSLGLIAAVNYVNNQMSVDIQNYTFLFPRVILEEGLKDGLLQAVPDGACFLVNNKNANVNYCDLSSFIRQNTGKRLNVIPKGRYLDNPDLRACSTVETTDTGSHRLGLCRNTNNLYYLNVEARSRGEGFVVLGKVHDLCVSDKSILGLTAQTAYVYVRLPYFWHKCAVQGNGIDRDRLQSTGAFVFRTPQMRLVDSGRSWRLFEVSAGDQFVDLRSLRVIIGATNYGVSTFNPISNDKDGDAVAGCIN